MRFGATTMRAMSVLVFLVAAAAGACSEDEGAGGGSCEHLCQLHAADQGWTGAEETACVGSCTDALAGNCTEPFCVYRHSVCSSSDTAMVQRCTQQAIDAVAGYGDWASARDAFFEAICGADPCCVLDHTC